MKKAYLIDPFSSGNYHEVINMSYLYLISKCYDEVVYVCDKSSYDNCMEKLSAQGLHVDNAKNIHIKSKHYKIKSQNLSNIITMKGYLFLFPFLSTNNHPNNNYYKHYHFFSFLFLSYPILSFPFPTSIQA